MNSEEVHVWADEVAMLMASRLGGTRRGEAYDLQTMIRRRGGALPRHLLKQAEILRKADQITAAPKIARQMDFGPAARAHQDLVSYLKPFGRLTRVQQKTTNVLATILFGFLILGIAVIWVLVWRGFLG